MNRMKIEYLDVNKIKSNKRNPRQHNESQLMILRDSIKRFGFTNPILVDHNNTIIAGHGRFQAAKLENMNKIPSIKLLGLTQKQKQALMIADNKIALESSWNEKLLAELMNELETSAGDLSSATGFTDREIGELLELLEDSSVGKSAGDESVIDGKQASDVGLGTMDTYRSDYTTTGYRNIIVILDEQQYSHAMKSLKVICKKNGFRNNSDAIYHLISECAEAKGKTGKRI